MSARKKLLNDSFVNFVSFGLLGVSGLAVNYFVARRFGPEGLGEFNIAYSVYILISQIAVGGCHMAILSYSARSRPESAENKMRFRAGLEEAFRISLWTSGLLLFGLLVGKNLGLSEDLVYALLLTVPALIFFSINKCCINYFNGIERLKTVGALNSFRAVMMLGFVSVACLYGTSPAHAVAAFFMTEGVLSLVCLIGLGCIRIGRDEIEGTSHDARREMRAFGYKAMPGNIMADVNSRVDVLMLGLLTNKIQTGFYSLPGMLIEGLLHFTVVLRTIVNGKLGREKSKSDREALLRLYRNGVILSYVVTIPMAAALYFAFPFILQYGGLDPSFIAGREPLLILTVLFCAISGFLPFVMAPNQFGMPGTQTRFYAVVFFVNVIGNLAFIPQWGIEGAAMATGLSFLVYGGQVICFFRRRLGEDNEVAGALT